MPRPRSLARALSALLSKARRGERAVQVEDVLALVPVGDAAAASVLRSAASGWPRTARLAPSDGVRVVPLGRWADYVCAVIEGGCDAVVALARSPDERRLDEEDGASQGGIALAVLEQVRNLDAVRAVLALAADARLNLPARRSLAVGCASALNNLTWFEPRVEVREPEAADARALLHALLAFGLSAAEAGTVFCAMRAVGDEASLRLLSAVGPLAPPWQSTASDAAKAIARRLRAR